MVGNHPMNTDEQFLARAYESWEPKVLWGEERFPHCAEGEEAYFVLKNYQDDNLAPAALKAHFDELARQNRVLKEEQAVLQEEAAVSPRKDSLSPSGQSKLLSSRFAGMIPTAVREKQFARG